MTKKATCIWAYLTWVGFIIALCQDCKDECKFHLNQGLVLNIFLSGVGLFTWIGVIPWIGWFLDIFVLCPIVIVLVVFWIISFVGACKGIEKETPLLGKIKIIK